MKRDPDLQTKILQRLEEAGPNDEIRSLDGYLSEAFCYNARQLHRARLIDIVDFGHKTDQLACMITGLTPAGHHVLDRARYDWRRKASAAAGNVAKITFETVLRAMLDHMIR